MIMSFAAKRYNAYKLSGSLQQSCCGFDVFTFLNGLFCADDERHFIAYVLAFFAASDGIVVENLAIRFMQGQHRVSATPLSFSDVPDRSF